MLINESGLVRCIKRAYKSAGYAVAAEGDCMTIYTEQWYIQCKRAAIPRKVLATIVEHMGMIPDTEPVSIVKDGEPQLIMPEVAADEIEHWVSLLDLVVMEREMVEHGAAAVIDGDRLLWRGDTEVVAMDAVRKARSSWAKEWERAVWNALEGVDLHKEEA